MTVIWLPLRFIKWEVVFLEQHAEGLEVWRASRLTR
jgi:hypothetical protein